MAQSRKSLLNANQQANWTNRGISLLVLDEKYGVDACELKEEEIVEKGQAAAAQAPAAKRKLTGEEPALKKKKTASKPWAAKSVKIPTRAMHMKWRRANRKRRRNRTSPKAGQQRKRQGYHGPRRAGRELHSRSQLVSPHQENNLQSQLQTVRRPLLNLWELSWQLLRRKSNFFVYCDISCARARATHCC